MSDIYLMPGHLIPQFAALAMIDDHPMIDQATLAGAIAFDRATIGGVVDRLVTKGLITRSTNPNDRRSRVLKLTPEGARALSALRPVVTACQDAILPSLTAAEKAEFIRLAAKIAASENEQSRAPLLEISRTRG